MGQKVNPIGFRLGVIRTWDSKWYEEKNYAKWLHEDIHLREFVKKKLGGSAKVSVDDTTVELGYDNVDKDAKLKVSQK